MTPLSRRSRRFLAVGAVLVAGLVTGRAQQAVFHGRADAVSVDVLVLDGKRTVNGLSAPAFEVTDNGEPQRVTDVSLEAVPRDWVFLVDESQSLTDPRVGTRSLLPTLPELLTTSRRPEDRVQVIQFASAMHRVDPASVRPTLLPIESSQTALYDTLVAAVLLPPDPDRRRVIVALTDGVDTISSTALATRAAVFDRSDAVIDVVNVAATTAIGRFGAFGDHQAAAFDRFAWMLRDVTARTGGRLFNVKPSDGFVATVRAAIDDSRARYVLRFTPTSAQPGWHALTVGVAGKRYDIHARHGYWRE